MDIYGMQNMLGAMQLGASPIPGQQTSQWMPNRNDLRADGTQKGMGYFGSLRRPDGKVSTELSIGVNIGGRETEIPTLVPTLSAQEKTYLLNTDPSQLDWKSPIGSQILAKARAHAEDRIKNKKSVFATPEDIMDKKSAPSKSVMDDEEMIAKKKAMADFDAKRAGYAKDTASKRTPTASPTDSQKAMQRRESIMKSAPSGWQRMMKVLGG